MKKKIPKIQIVRFITQVMALIFVPGLFTLAFSQLGQIYTMIIKGNFNIIQSWPRLIAVLTTIPLTIILGRFFCGWFCAFGAFNDFIYIISRKIFKIKLRINERLDSILKYLKYIILVFIVFVMWTKGNSLFESLSPWNAFAQITQFPQAIFQYPIGFLILAFIAIGAFFIERFFCRYLCPLGAVFSIVSKVRGLKIDKPKDKCGKCRLCTNNCSMGINLYKVDKVSSGECINCLKCIETCPRKNTQVNIYNENINPAFASAVAITAFTGVYAANTMLGGIIERNNPTTAYNNSSISNSIVAGENNQALSNNSNATLQGKYKDGTYTGVGRGFRPGLTVSVTIKSNKITNIQIISHNETMGYYEQPFSVVPKEIIQSQSTQVDAVSGATRSSNGIMAAVNDALSQAKVSEGSTDSNTSVDSNNNGVSTNTNVPVNNSSSPTKTSNSSIENNNLSVNNNSNTSQQKKYKDGTYTGVGRGFRPGLTVSVTVKDGKINSINIISHHETSGYYEEPFNVVPKEIIQSQSTQVDAVSGATRSSNGIMAAVDDALRQAQM